jgi:HSP20 family protein
MALVRREPAPLQTELNRLFYSLFDTPTHPARGRGASPLHRWIPAVDLVENDDHYTLRADLPGLSQDDVNVELDGNVLTVSGERKSEREERRQGYYRLERASGSFSRSLRVPDGVDANAITANFENGVLEVKVPKPEHAKPQKVAITVADGAAKTIEGSGSTAEGSEGTTEGSEGTTEGSEGITETPAADAS